MKETKKLLEIKKILITMGLSTCLATTLTGCTKKREMTFVEYLDAKYDDTYDYFNGDENLKVIRIKDFNGNESYHLARRIPGLISKDNVLNIDLGKSLLIYLQI